MKSAHIKKIESDFSTSEYEFVFSQLESVELRHVMAESQFNLDNTRSAILYLCNGNIKELMGLVETAKNDFRDVISMAIKESNAKSNLKQG